MRGLNSLPPIKESVSSLIEGANTQYTLRKHRFEHASSLRKGLVELSIRGWMGFSSASTPKYPKT
jgi:hypothetical protein